MEGREHNVITRFQFQIRSINIDVTARYRRSLALSVVNIVPMTLKVHYIISTSCARWLARRPSANIRVLCASTSLFTNMRRTYYVEADFVVGRYLPEPVSLKR